MLSASIVCNPVDIGAERSASSMSCKEHSDGHDFASVLDTKVKNDQPEVKPRENSQSEKPQQKAVKNSDDGSEQTAVVKDSETEKADVNSTEAANESDETAAEAEVVDKTVKAEASQIAAELVVASTLQAVVANTGLVVPTDVNVEGQEASSEEPVVIQAIAVVDTAGETPFITDNETAVVASTDAKPNETEAAGIPITLQSSEVETSDESASEPKLGEMKAQARKSFLGLLREGSQQVSSGQSLEHSMGYGFGQLKQGSDGAPSETKDAALETLQAIKAGSPLRASQVAFAGDVQLKSAAELPKGFGAMAQAFSLLGEEMNSQVVSAVGASSSETTGGDANSNSASTNDSQAGLLGVPMKSSFDTVVKGLENVKQATALPAADQEAQIKIIDQVVKEVRLRQFSNQSDILVRLNPPEMGALRLQVTQGTDGMTGQIHASSDHVRNLLQANLPALIQALSDAGLKVEQVSVTSNSSFNSHMQDTASGTAYQQQNGKSRQHHSGDEAAVSAAALGAAVSALEAGQAAGYSWLA